MPSGKTKPGVSWVAGCGPCFTSDDPVVIAYKREFISKTKGNHDAWRTYSVAPFQRTLICRFGHRTTLFPVKG